jgi:hypothetical protein
MVWAAAEGKVVFSTGEVGVPLVDALVTDLSFAEAEGTGSQLWAGVGLAGSSGGALRLFFGTDEIGGECKTSFYTIIISNAKETPTSRLTQLDLGSRNLHQTPSSKTSFIFRHRLRNTPSIRLRRSMILASSFALVGFAA